MKKKRSSTEQIAAVLHQAEQGILVGELCRQVGISEQSLYRWKKVYGGLQPSEARELKQLRVDVSKLKRLKIDRLRPEHADALLAVAAPGATEYPSSVSAAWLVSEHLRPPLRRLPSRARFVRRITRRAPELAGL